MTVDIVAEWREWRPALVSLCLASKDAQAIPITLSHEFGKLAPEQQAEVESLLREWVLSADNSERFDALAVVEDHNLTSLIPTLRVLRDRLEDSTEVGAVHEWEKVNRVLGRLVAAAEGATDFPSDERTARVMRSGPEWRAGDVAWQWRAWFASLYRRPTRWRSAPRVLQTASSGYGSMSPEERLEIEPVLSEWLLSEDHTERIAALTIASEHHVTSLIPALLELVDRLRDEPGAEAQSQHRWVSEVLRRLQAIAAGGSAYEVHDSTDRTRRG